MSADSRWQRAVIALAAIATVAATARLGWWQWSRGQEKEALGQVLDARSAMAPLTERDLPRTAVAATAHWQRPVRLRGRWMADRTLFLDNRTMDQRTGLIVVTPLRLEGSGDAIAVQRGWLPRDAADPRRLPAVPTPDGAVEVSGRLVPAPSQRFEFEGAPPGAIRQNVDLAAYSREIGVPLRPMSVQQSDEQADGLLRRWQLPAIDAHKNFGYAVQWFAMAALVAALYVWFQILRPRIRNE